MISIRTLAFLFFCAAAYGQAASSWLEERQVRLDIDGHEAFIVHAETPHADGTKPWVWYAPTFLGKHPDSSHEWMFKQFVDAGFSICGVDVGESFGNAKGVAVYSKLFDHVTREYGLDNKACLLPQSRGGLMLLNWAIENPDEVQCIAGIYTVCNIESYPGVERAASAYGKSAEDFASTVRDVNPIHRWMPLAQHQVPTLFLHGDSDEVVPTEKNAGLLVQQLHDAGGIAKLITVKGKGHEVCPEFFQSQPFTNFILSRGESLVAETQWHDYAMDGAGTRFSRLNQIDRENVKRLERAWTYRTGDIAREGAHYAECTPLMVDGSVYVITPFSRLVVLDAVTGALQWEFNPDPPLNHRETGAGGLASRGVTYHKFNDGKERVYLPVRDGRIYCIDVETHKPDPAYGKDGMINMREGLPRDGEFLFLSSPPTVHDGILIQPYGINDTSNTRNPYVPVRAYNALTGDLAWTFDTVPRPGELGHDTWENDSWKDRGACNPWAAITVDRERGIFYLPIGAPNNDKYGGDRPGHNLFSNSIVALESATGKYLWHFQTVHHDLWDYDLAAHPNLFDIQRDDETIPAVAVVGKTGFAYVFNRVTGEPIFPIEERPVPASDFHDEAAAATQPFPTAPPPFSRQGITPEQLNNAASDAPDRLAKMRAEGLFTPPSGQGSVVNPGQLGGANWSGAAVSSDGHMYVAANELPYYSTIKKGSGDFGISVQARHFLDDDGKPVVKPPWGTLTRLDLAKGTLDWQMPLGDYGGHDEPTGTMNFGGATVTAGGLVFIAASIDGKFRAFDADTGEVVFETDLEVSGQGAPITYLGSDRKQYICLYAGGGGKGKAERGDYVVAYRLGDE